MHLGLFEITLLLGAAASAIAGALAARARRRAPTLLVLNGIFAACFAYFAMKGLRFGSIIGILLGIVALLHVAVGSAIVERASRARI
jgi:hypothetical protein